MTSDTYPEQASGGPYDDQRIAWCRQIWVEGVVRGVGYRPVAYTLAVRLRFTGLVLRDSQGVLPGCARSSA